MTVLENDESESHILFQALGTNATNGWTLRNLQVRINVFVVVKGAQVSATEAGTVDAMDVTIAL